MQGTDTFYTSWCATYPCAGGVEFGIVDYGHRPTPDAFLNAAYTTGGVWNSAQYASPDFDAAFKEFEVALDVDSHKAACKKLETIANDDTPNAIPYFYNYLSGFSKKFSGRQGQCPRADVPRSGRQGLIARNTGVGCHTAPTLPVLATGSLNV